MKMIRFGEHWVNPLQIQAIHHGNHVIYITLQNRGECLQENLPSLWVASGVHESFDDLKKRAEQRVLELKEEWEAAMATLMSRVAECEGARPARHLGPVGGTGTSPVRPAGSTAAEDGAAAAAKTRRR